MKKYIYKTLKFKRIPKGELIIILEKNILLNFVSNIHSLNLKFSQIKTIFELNCKK